jgi:hypothetical protein
VLEGWTKVSASFVDQMYFVNTSVDNIRAETLRAVISGHALSRK